MQKSGILLTSLSLIMACQSLMAQDTANHTLSRSTIEVPKTALDVPDYNSLPPGVNLLKRAIRNPDGSFTIKAGQQTAEANEINRRYCESLGGTDATNKTDQLIGAGTLYAVVCEGPVNQPRPLKTQNPPGNERNPLQKKQR